MTEDSGLVDTDTDDELSHKFGDCITHHHFGVMSIQCQDSVVRFGSDGKQSRRASMTELGVKSSWELRGVFGTKNGVFGVK
jgi:hypothetical protein